jgi:UDP-N-acetylglucosamine 2-epimerase (non-hydrolysing)
MKILSVVGARPNFMKIAPFIKAIEKHNRTIASSPHHLISSSSYRQLITHLLVHTGQHYDDRMSKSFFENFDLPEADINLGIGSGTHGEQVGNTMIAFEKVLQSEKPDWVVVVGDVNATLACSVTSKKENIKCCHIEAGLRSGDMSMPEEINRLVTDRLSDLLLTPDKISFGNLQKEGISKSRIRFVGNILIDTLEANWNRAAGLQLTEIVKRNVFLEHPFHPSVADDKYVVITLHRPSNVDDKETFSTLVHFLSQEIAHDLPLIWPIHPRAMKNLKQFGLWQEVIEQKNLLLLHPVSYLDMLRLNIGAKLVLTDSGGLQEECTVLGTPCLTLRWNTERPVTLREHGGASILVGNNIDRIREEYKIASKLPRTPVRPELWDGHAAERCLMAILEYSDK